MNASEENFAVPYDLTMTLNEWTTYLNCPRSIYSQTPRPYWTSPGHARSAELVEATLSAGPKKEILEPSHDHAATYVAYLGLKQQNEDVQSKLDAMYALSPPYNSGGVKAQGRFSELRTAVREQTELLHQLLQTVPPLARYSPMVESTADGVFRKPEMLRMILLYLDFFDLLRAQQVNRTWFHIIKNSEELQRKLCLKPHAGCHFYSPWQESKISSVYVTSRVWNSEQDPFIFGLTLLPRSMYPSTAPYVRLGPNVGLRCRSMLVCQPPIKTMDVHTNCCQFRPIRRLLTENDPSEETPRVETLTAENRIGITIGDVLDRYARIVASHRICPYALHEIHDEEGFIRPTVTFRASVRLCKDDPIVLDYKQGLERYEKGNQERHALLRRRNAYVKAKMEAKDRGQPIPTLAEFEADPTANTDSDDDALQTTGSWRYSDHDPFDMAGDENF